MEALIAPSSSSSSSSPLSVFSSKKNPSRRNRFFTIASKGCDADEETDRRNDPSGTSLVPLFKKQVSLSPLSKDVAMGLVLGAAAGRGWTTGSGMEGPSVPACGSDPATSNQISTFPWSLFTKSPRRRMRVSFTCNVCGQRTTRAINPHAYTDGTVFVQCCGCNVFHKLVDNLNLFHEMKCYVNPNFRYKGDAPFNYWGEDEDSDEMFPMT